MIPVFQIEKCAQSFKEKKLFHNLSFTVNSGDFFTISGPSGSGKSTLLQILLGFREPQEGRVRFKGDELAGTTLKKLRSQVAVVFQEPRLLEDSVEEALLAPFHFKQNRTSKPSVEEMQAELKAVGLPEEYLIKEITKLSGGEKQRVALVRALLLKRPVLILDEISSALDVGSRDTIFAYLKQKSTTTIVVSHDKEWIKNSPQVLDLEEGAVHDNR